MDDYSEAFMTLYPGQLNLLVAPRQVCQRVLCTVIARLALDASLQVIDSGNLFDAYLISRFIRCQTERLEDTLKRIVLQRAFTCYQLHSLLTWPGRLPVPTLVMDLLGTFYDDNIPLAERQRLLKACLESLKWYAKIDAVVVGATLQKSGQPDYLLECLKAQAGQVCYLEVPDPPECPRLF